KAANGPNVPSLSRNSKEASTYSEEVDREGYTCAVCLDVYFSPYSCHPCGHIFCEPCLRTLAKNRPANTPCPLCRTLISHTLFQKGELRSQFMVHTPPNGSVIDNK
uniref:RING-type domain-containing protein n=1 Tax=Hucho hucho TaxID=62062 RepID=A0A4W5QMK7_9TELE